MIEDSIHCDRIEECESFEEAVARLERLARSPWDREPNRAPCASWRKCGREYRVIGYDDSSIPWKVVREADVLKVSASHVEWVPGFRFAWAERLGG